MVEIDIYFGSMHDSTKVDEGKEWSNPSRDKIEDTCRRRNVENYEKTPVYVDVPPV